MSNASTPQHLKTSKPRCLKPVFLSAAMALLSCLATARAEFMHSATLTVSGYAGAAVANFPVLVRVSPARINGFAYEQVTSETGADLAFYSEDGDTCPHDVDTWNTNGESLVWVRLPSLEKNARFVFRWGDSSVTAKPASRDLWSSVGASKHYFGVWHLGEEILTAAGSVASADSACYSGDVNMDATPVASYSGNTADMTSDENGILGRSRWNSKTNGRFLTGLQVKGSSGQKFGSSITLSGWFNASDTSANECTFFTRCNWIGENVGYAVFGTGKGKLAMCGASSSGLEVTLPDFLDKWVHLACVYDGANACVYVNGVEAGRSANMTPPSDPDKYVAFGATSVGSHYAFGGRYDELRFLGAAASADWVAAEYQTVTVSDFVTEYVPGNRDVTLVAEPTGAGDFSINGTAVSEGTTSVVESGAVTFSVQPAEGYEFVCWEWGVKPQNASSSEVVLPVFEERTLKAKFVAVDPDHAAADVTWSSGAPSFDTGDRVTVPANATVVLTDATAHLASFDVSGTVIVSNWFSRLWADAITVRNGGVIRAGADFPMLNGGVSNRVWLAGASLAVESGGVISADTAGYAGTNGPCWTASVTRNVVNASQVNISPYGGAYGGTPGYDGVREFSGTAWGVAPEPYGSAEWPFDPGSGGGAFIRAGGGAIFLDFTGGVRLDGTVRANASDADYGGYPPWESDIKVGWHYNNGPYGSGGGIVIRCASVTGSGTVSANSCVNIGAGGYGGGSGGRIAVHYNAAVQRSAACSVRFETTRGISYHGKETIELRGLYEGGPGTLWFTDNSFLDSYAATGWKFGGEWHSGAGTPNPLAVDGNLTVDGSLLRFTEDDFSFSVSGDLTLAGAKEYAKMCGLSFASRTAFSVGGSVSMTDSMLEFAAGGTAAVGGDFTMCGSDARRTGAMVVLTATTTNQPTDVAMSFAVSGTWSLGKYAICLPICDPTDGAAPKLSAGSLYLDDDAEISASYCGFGPKKGPGYKGSNIGASHGGLGGSKRTDLTPAAVYDEETDPRLPGSGDYGCTYGGGVVDLTVAKIANVRGKILADAFNPSVFKTPGYQAGSSGGTINLRAYRLKGGDNSLLSALGGTSWNALSGRWYYADLGTGGGGRIAIRTAYDLTDWREDSTHVTAGAYGAGDESITTSPTDGTVYWGYMSKHGLVLLVR